jgi:AcrR family transcriptional regulator
LKEQDPEVIDQDTEFTDPTTTKGKIFMEAARLFADRGYHGVSMRELSESTGVSKPTIYYYFENKEGIYKALMQTGLHYNLKQFERIVEKDISIKQKITELVKMRFQQVHDYPEFARFFIKLFLGSEKMPFLKSYIDEAIERRKLLVKLIEQGVRDGEFGPGADPKLAAEIFTGAILHFMMKQLETKEKILTDRLAQDIVDLVFRGLNE